MTQLKISPLLTAALIMCATSARAEVQKFLNPCSGQKLCAYYTLVLTPPDGWVVDDKATNENKVEILVPKGQSFASAEPLIYVQKSQLSRHFGKFRLVYGESLIS